MYTGTCRKRELQPEPSSASLQGHTSQDEQCLQVMGHFMLDRLPEDIVDNLFSYLPIEDAARAACVSRRYLRSWRRYPRLLFNNKTVGYDKLSMHLDEDTRALEDEQYRQDKIESHFVNKINHVLENHSGFGMKVLILQLYPCANIDASYFDKWLRIAVKPGIEELALEMAVFNKRADYNFPIFLLSNEIGGATLESLRLTSCAFHPTASLGCNRSLTSVYLSFVRITGEELGQFVSNCFALARLSIYKCNDLICFKAPCVLHHLNHFHVTQCKMLQVIEIRAPKLSTFDCGDNLMQISLGAEVKHIRMIGSKPNTLCHARAEIPCFMPAVERLTVESICEVKTPIMSSKFLLLKYLDIFLVDVQLYRQDYFSLVSFLEASPALETFMLRVETGYVLRSDSVLKDLDKDQLHLRQMPECLHYNLKNVMMTGFSSAKSLIELTSHIVRNASALVCMTLDTAWGCGRRTTKTDKCEHMSKEGLMEAQRALEAVNRCIEGIVPSSTNFKALEPCCQCGG
ncbi:hypothetical protein SEVIR_8G147200v4 [Setaria viridis]|uniref:F-box domain-containing protein n=1 Tax=Setaria viridis TaxID=4556 RepID=A0A4U6TFE0_SETVI|nr:hypothetical protein SEVIR_8G147200v2 [Setaria viridis]